MTVARACLASVVALAFSGIAWAQDSEPSQLAKQLAAALEAAKVESIAARDPTRPGTYVAALYFSGTELLVVSAQYAVPTLLDRVAQTSESKSAVVRGVRHAGLESRGI